MASTSSAVDSCDNDDVFLSFRGVDTRCNFTSHLYDALCRNDIKVFIDYEIKRGDVITPALGKAIEGAKISIIIFSADYASSTSCLFELVEIMKCRKSKGQIVFPIFYQVEPSVDTYQEAFDRHKANLFSKRDRSADFHFFNFHNLISKRKRSADFHFFNFFNSFWIVFRFLCTIQKELKNLKEWNSALSEALELAGWHIKKDSDEVDFIRRITKAVSETLENSQSNGQELMCTSIVGQTAEDIFKQVREWLMDNDISRVGIYGLGGVGKTTIANRIYDELLHSNAFDHVCLVTVSKELSIYKIQNEIAKAIKLDLSKEDDEQKRAAKLRKKLKTRKFLLILDDVWEDIETIDVGISPSASVQKILVISRDHGVCQRMDCQSIEVKPLSEHDALVLFMKESKYKLKDSLEWKAILRSIVRKCAGLPLAIVTVARPMRGVVEIKQWRNALRQLENPCEGENQEVEKRVFRSLKFSFDRLSSNEVRQCFLYCSLFPEDFLFKRNDLITYWIGEEIINKLYSKQAELDKGHCMIEELINVSLLQHTSFYEEDFIKMHDLVRDMALIVIRENSKAQDGLKVQGLSEETRWRVNLKSVLTMEDSMFKTDVPNLPPNCSRLTTLSFNNVFDEKTELPSNFFASMQNLAVLDLRSTEGLTLLPNSISCLVNLRVLLVSYCWSLEYIPSLARLENLWHLDLCWTNLKEIPKGVKRLINLRVLKLSLPCDFLPKLSNLQILELEEGKVETDAVISLEKLEILRITFYNLESLNSYFKSGHWKRLKEYCIVGFQKKEGSSENDLWIEEVVEDKKILYIGELREEDTDMVLPKNIQLLWSDKWNGPMVDVVMNSTFGHLQQLEIFRCGDMPYLFTSALAQRVLLNVEILYIRGARKVEEIISREIELAGNNYPTIRLPKLKRLTLEKFSNLRSIYKGRMVCPSLELIRIEDCGKLEKLPFCIKEDEQEEERNKHNPIQLKVSNDKPNEWWDSLHWDNPNAKSMYQFEANLNSRR